MRRLAATPIVFMPLAAARRGDVTRLETDGGILDVGTRARIGETTDQWLDIVRSTLRATGRTLAGRGARC